MKNKTETARDLICRLKEYGIRWNGFCPDIEELTSSAAECIARLEAENRAVLADLQKVSVCGTCAHYRPRAKNEEDKCGVKGRRAGIASNYAGCSKWLWRGHKPQS